MTIADTMHALRSWGHDDLATQVGRAAVEAEGPDAIPAIDLARVMTTDELDGLVNP